MQSHSSTKSIFWKQSRRILWEGYFYGLNIHMSLLFSCSVMSNSFMIPKESVAHQDPLWIGFSMQEYWSGLPCPPPGDPDPGIDPASLMSPALAGGFFTTTTTWEAQFLCGWTASSELPSQILRLFLFLILLCIRYFFYRFAIDISYFLQFKWSNEFCYKFSWITL